MNTTINGYASPSAYVTKGKQRLKQNNDTVYLNNGDEFEVELYNPTQGKILSKIEINGNAIGGIIIRPGERVFLERYLNEAKKFLFETYKVSGDNSEIKKAIEKNGNISVKFYQEYVAPPINFGSLTIGNSDWNNGITYFNSGTVTTTTNPGTFTTNTPLFTTGTNINTSTYTSNGNSTFTSQVFNTTSTNNVNTDSLGDKLRSRSLSKSKMKKLTLDEPKEIETGRIEKGSNSNQNFTYDYSQFNSWHNWKSEWKILPLSQKPMVIEDIKVFCTECGSKRKKDSHKFCPQCGTKF